MKPWTVLVPALLSFGCSNDPGPTPEGKLAATEQKLGQISLDLLGQDRAGHAYRLRNATFDIQSFYLYVPTDADAGPVSVKVSSDTHPNATSITTRVLPGYYDVTLERGWFLEKVNGKTATRVDQAILLQEATTSAYVCENCIANVHYSFGVDGTLIDFFHGDLSIDFDVQHPDAGAASDGG